MYQWHTLLLQNFITATIMLNTAKINKKIIVMVKDKLEKGAQGKPSAKCRPTRLVVDAALRRIGKTRHGGNKIANISMNCQRI